MGIWIFTDTHLGARSNSMEWLDMMQDAHENFIYKTIVDNWKEGDIVIHTGDVFDNRTAINLKVLDYGIKFFGKLAKLCPVHIIAGNHDIYFKNSTEITSLDMLKYIDNINILKEPEVLTIDNKNLLLMPWRKDIKEESDTLKEFQKSHNCDYAFMHGTFSLIKYTKYVNIDADEGMNPKSAEGYKRVYTGHIHWSQTKGNINVVGTPYQITRGDSGNPKGMFYLDLETGKETFYENTISPKFLSFTIDKLDKQLFVDINEQSKNNHVDIHVHNNILVKHSANLTKLFHKISEQSRTLNVFPIETDQDSIDESNAGLDTKELIINELKKRFENDSDRSKAKTIVDDIIKTI